MKRVPIIAGNWKMNKTSSETMVFIDDVQNLLMGKCSVSVIFAPPFTGLWNRKITPPFYIAAQNCHWEDAGAYTGEISPLMLKDCGVEYVILGHSERRHIFGETNTWINRKIRSTLKHSLKPIFCIGETLDQRKKGKMKEVLQIQIEKGLKSISSIKNCVIAYEPVWAIGTGLTANIEQIEEAHSWIRQIINNMFGEMSNNHILYGGSVNQNNAGELINVPSVDGFLIGGASLDSGSFSSIIKTVQNFQE